MRNKFVLAITQNDSKIFYVALYKIIFVRLFILLGKPVFFQISLVLLHVIKGTGNQLFFV